MRIFRFFTAISFLVLVLVWAAPSAPAADATASPRVAAATRPPAEGPLKPGRTAGVKGAQQARAGLALIGAGAIIAVVVVAAGSSGGGSGGSAQNNFAPTTTTP